jgi:hypothetical protein
MVWWNEMTLLALTGIGIPPFSARGITQTLEPIDAAVVQRRTINGVLVDLGQSEFRKYLSSLSCADMTSPAFNEVVIGTILTVDCIPELSVAGTLPTPHSSWTGNARPIVPGSLRERDGFIFYRPRLTMMVVGHSVEKDEFGAVVTWSLDLEEV